MILEQLFLFANAPGSCEKQFFGLLPWYHYLPAGDFESGGCGLRNFTFLSRGNPSDIPLVLLAVADDLLRIAGMVAVGFVVYGAIQYITSQGNPEQAGRAQTTIINALLGLAIAVVAVAFVAFIGNKLGG